MKDRRPLVAMLLIFLIAFAPAVLWRNKALDKQKAAAAAAALDSLNKSAAAVPQLPAPVAPTMGAVSGTQSLVDSTGLSVAPVVQDTIVVHSGLYRYRITNHGKIVSAQLLHYQSLITKVKGDTIELLPLDAPLLGTKLVLGSDTLHFDQIAFTANTKSLDVTTAPASLTMTGTSGAYRIDLTWNFVPDDYHFDFSGRITGLGAVGGTLLIDLGNGFQDTEANIPENHRESGIVTMQNKSKLLRFGSLEPRVLTPISGPFDWVAIKSKYFVAGLFAVDTANVDGVRGRIAGLQAYAADSAKAPARAHVTAAIGVPAAGNFGYRVYLGPMEYDRLTAMSNDFDDVNPYGWPGLRTIIRPFAVGIRAVFVWMHHTLGFGYGWVIVLFGILVRILLWPLNQKAMRSMTAMQAIQPEMQAIQERYKDDKARLQQEMLTLYKEHNVNPFGGCWPMLLPYPLLVAVFFVLQNTIELRGVPFWWFADLSRADSTWAIAILMAGSMFLLQWIGQKGLPPNPQTKMFMYIMPPLMLFMFGGLAAGLNLYYFIQNVASLPQQLLISKERQKLLAARTAPQSSGKKVEVKTRK